MNDWDALDARFGTPTADQPDSWDVLDKRVRQSAARMPEKPKAEPVRDFTGTLRFGSLDTGIELPEGVNRRLAQLGSGFADWTARIDQLRGKTTTQDVDEKRVRDKALNDDFTGKALNFTGKALPTLAVPYMAGAPVVSGAAGGAVIGAMEPVGTGESALANTAMGAGFGAAVPLAIKGFQAAAKPSADVAKDVATAQKYGIPIGIADASKNNFVRGARSFTNDLPLVGMPGQRLKSAQEEAFTRAVGDTFGANASRLTPDVLDAAKQRMGAEFDRLWGRNNLAVDNTLMQQLQTLQGVAADMPKSQRANVDAKIQEFLSKMYTDANGNVVVKGDAANNFQQWLRGQAGGQRESYMQNAFTDLRKSVIDGFNRSIGPQDAAALTQNRTQYKAFKTVEPLLDKGAVGTAGRAEGVVPPALLSEAARRSYSGASSQTSPPALVELAGMGSRLLADRVPQTGGSPRAALQNMGIGAGLMGGSYAAPMTTALTTAGGTGLNYLLNSPRVAAAVLGGGKKRGLLDPARLDEMLAETLLLGGVRAPLAVPGLLSLPAAE